MTPAQWAELEKAKDGGKPWDEMSLRTKVLLAATLDEQEHPDDYEGPCGCRSCMSYADIGDVDGVAPPADGGAPAGGLRGLATP